jgi:hypothetical protein
MRRRNATFYSPSNGGRVIAIKEETMSPLEVGKKLVELCNRGEDSKAVDTLYDAKIVSIEGEGAEGMPARMEGIDAIRGKH